MQLKLAISSGMGGMSDKHQQEPLAPENTPAPEAPKTMARLAPAAPGTVLPD